MCTARFGLSALLCLRARSSWGRSHRTHHFPAVPVPQTLTPRPRLIHVIARLTTHPAHISSILGTLPQRVVRAPEPRGKLLLLRQCTRCKRSREHPATGLMTTIFARSPLEPLSMATNRPTTRRRSVKQAFEDDDAPAPKRPRTEVNGTGKRAGATKKTAKAAYDEDDDGFQFTRRTTRKTAKAQAVPAPEPIPEEPHTKTARSQDPAPAKSTARQKKASIAAIEPEPTETNKRRRSTRLSGDREELEVRPKPTDASTKRVKKSVPAEKERKKQITPAPEAQAEQKAVVQGIKTPTHNELTVAKKRDPNAQRIMLPFADTPVITRNKEMRKGSKEGHRRSSTGLRGRRASSLIDSGMSNGKFSNHTPIWSPVARPNSRCLSPHLEHTLITCSSTALRS